MLFPQSRQAEPPCSPTRPLQTAQDSAKTVGCVQCCSGTQRVRRNEETPLPVHVSDPTTPHIKLYHHCEEKGLKAAEVPTCNLTVHNKMLSSGDSTTVFVECIKEDSPTATFITRKKPLSNGAAFGRPAQGLSTPSNLLNSPRSQKDWSNVTLRTLLSSRSTYVYLCC